jgi:hypothetical protein
MYSKYTPLANSVRQRNPLAPQPVDLSGSSEFEFAEAIVLDVVVNEDHEYFNEDGYNVGSVKVRVLQTDLFKDINELTWAYPSEVLVEEWPLKNEIVRVFRMLNKLYYTKPVNIGKYSSNQAMFGLAPETEKVPSSEQSSDAIRKSKHSPRIVKSRNEEELGDYFEDVEEYRLRHWEGDVIKQGRSGQSIRLGSTFLDSDVHRGIFRAKERDQSATIIITAGHDSDKDRVPNNQFGRVTEDFDVDATSLWMIEDGILEFKTATRNTSSYRKVTGLPSVINHNFMAINTGTVLINSKREGIHLSSKKTVTFSSVDGVFSETDGPTRIYSIGPNEVISRNRVSLMASKVFIGSRSNTSQPLVLGTELTNLLIQLIQAFISSAPAHVFTTMGPAPLNPQVVAALQTALVSLQSRTILSNDNFVSRTNDTVS